MTDPTYPKHAPTVDERIAALEALGQRLEAQTRELARDQRTTATDVTAAAATPHGRNHWHSTMKVLELVAIFGGVVVGVWTIREAKHQYIETHRATVQQLELAREQNNKLQVQIDTQREQDYIARRAELLATLYDRKENCDPAEHMSGGCPHKASRRSREEALRAFTYIEHTRPKPELSLRLLVLPRANLAGLNLRNADLSGADLQDCELEDANLEHANLAGADLVRAHLERANLDHAKLAGANLASASLERASLRYAQLTAYLDNTHLEHADLTGAHLRHDTLATAYRDGINIQGVQFELPAPNGASDQPQ